MEFLSQLEVGTVLIGVLMVVVRTYYAYMCLKSRAYIYITGSS